MRRMDFSFHTDGTLPANSPATIFVFGSNEAGRHGKGAAKVAAERFAARRGQGVGRTGNAYAIPTKSATLAVLPLTAIEPRIGAFLAYARQHGDLTFFVTRVGCGLAGYRDADIAPLFVGAPRNCDFPIEWRPWLDAAGGDR